ncbi:MAG: glycosyltransferase [Verrucomicrobia bacterium]|jgi:glycosyltransferase involved in cell wall biosynthesis|nr:glycosyltransferase [Verrucomicrobiota bacterium]
MKNKRVLMVLYKYFHEDPRPQREAAALVRNGYTIDVICPRPSRDHHFERENMCFSGPVIDRKRGSRFRYAFEYGTFLAYAFLASAYLQLRHRYRVVQIFVMPEILMLDGLIPKLLGAHILMDWEDPSTEVYLAKYCDDDGGGRLLKVLQLFERLGLSIANRVIVPNIGFTRAFEQRGLPVGKIDVVMNGVDSALFTEEGNSIPHRDGNGRFVVFYNGSIIPRHGLHILIEAMRKVVDVAGNAAVLRIIGHGEPGYIASCRKQIEEAGLGSSIEWLGHVNIKEIPGLVASSSVGVIPNLENAFTRINFPQRIFEFATLKKPLVIARMDGIEDYLSERDVAFFPPGDHDALAHRLIELYRCEKDYQVLAENIHSTCAGLEWEQTYLEHVNQMVERT